MSVTASFLEIPPIVSLQGNPCVFAVSSSLTNASDIYMHARIQELVGGNWTDTTMEDMLPLYSGSAEFPVQGYFDGIFKPEFSFPENETNLIIPRPQMSKQFRLKIWETYLDAQGVTQTKETEPAYSDARYMLPGGISDDDLAILNENNTDWWTEHLLAGHALNWLPGTKTVAPDSIEKLYWIQATTGAATLRFSYKDTAGVSGTFEFQQAVTAYITQELCVSPALLEKLTGKTIASYTVLLVGTNLTQAYTVDRQYYEWSDHFIMSNSFAAYETMWCRGNRTGKVNYDRQKYERTDRRNMRLFDRTSGNIRTEFTRVHETNTGYFGDDDQNWIDWTIDLLNTEDAYRIDGLRIYPIVLNSDSVDIEDRMEDIWNMKFEWQYARKSKFWSRMGLMPDKTLPPYYSKLSAWFYKRVGVKLIDAIAGREAQISGSNLVFPDITGNDVFDFSDATFWDQTLIAATGWYNAGTPRTCPLTWLLGVTWAEAATDATHARLFHPDFNGLVKSVLPVLVYGSNLSATEQQIVVDWLKWYFVIFKDSAIGIDDNGNTYIL
jgi:hypothetical protein